MPKLTLLVGPPGSGKSTFAKDPYYFMNVVYVNQDSQGKAGHQEIFRNAIYDKKDIVVDRMGFNKQQRENYLTEAKKHGYQTEIVVLHQPYAVCLDRILKRIGNHETITDEKGARAALQTFFTKYERPTPDEADEIKFMYPDGEKPLIVWCDLDGTIADCEHRRHFVRPENNGKKDWVGFFKEMANDIVINRIADVLKLLSYEYKITYCSGRPDDYKKITTEWLNKNNLNEFLNPDSGEPYTPDLFMRRRHDSRQDNIVKEIILDFEILTRYNVFVCLDDRDQVVQMLRGRGLTVLQVADGGF